MRRSSNISEVVMPEPLQIGLVIFPKVTQLDLTGPVQVFSSVPGAKVHLIWKRIEPVATDSVLTLTPTITFADCPQLDVICVPGGFSTDEVVNARSAGPGTAGSFSADERKDRARAGSPRRGGPPRRRAAGVASAIARVNDGADYRAAANSSKVRFLSHL